MEHQQLPPILSHMIGKYFFDTKTRVYKAFEGRIDVVKDVCLRVQDEDGKSPLLNECLKTVFKGDMVNWETFKNSHDLDMKNASPLMCMNHHNCRARLCFMITVLFIIECQGHEKQRDQFYAIFNEIVKARIEFIGNYAEYQRKLAKLNQKSERSPCLLSL